MTLYRNINGEDTLLSEDEEALVRSSGVELIRGVNGIGYIMSEEEEAETRAEWEANENPDIPTDKINAEIDRLLADTDWTQITDADLTNAEKAQWTAYRIALRAVDRTPRPRNLGFPLPPSNTKRNGR